MTLNAADELVACRQPRAVRPRLSATRYPHVKFSPTRHSVRRDRRLRWHGNPCDARVPDLQFGFGRFRTLGAAMEPVRRADVWAAPVWVAVL